MTDNEAVRRRGFVYCLVVLGMVLSVGYLVDGEINE